MTIDVPDAALPGDLLILAIAYRNTFFAFPDSSGWSVRSLMLAVENANSDSPFL